MTYTPSSGPVEALRDISLTVDLINTYMPDMPRKAGCDEVFTTEFLTKIDMPRR